MSRSRLADGPPAWSWAKVEPDGWMTGGIYVVLMIQPSPISRLLQDGTE
jgi:hypothetical protein